MMCCQENHSRRPKFVFLQVSFPKKFPIQNTKSCSGVCQNMAFKWFLKLLPTHAPPYLIVPKKAMMKETKVYVFLPFLFPTFPMTNPTQKVQKWSTFSCSRVAVLFLGQDFAFFLMT